MPKKVAKGTTRSGAAREFQRRMQVNSTVSGNTATTLPEDEGGVAVTAAPTSGNGAANASATPVAPRPTSAGLSTNTRLRGSGAAALAPTRPGTSTRASAPLYGGPLGARARGAQAVALAVDDELSYIKGDVRRLIILAVIGFVILIALGFILPSIILG
jgi:hypothetical protein